VLDYNDWAYHNEICNNEVKWKAKLNNKHMGKWKLMHPIFKWFFKKNMKRRRIKKKKEGEENGCEKRGKKKWKSESHKRVDEKNLQIFLWGACFCVEHKHSYIVIHHQEFFDLFNISRFLCWYQKTPCLTKVVQSCDHFSPFHLVLHLCWSPWPWQLLCQY
jgi:hypothetical protein